MIDQLKEFVRCTHQQAVLYATNIDREGRYVDDYCKWFAKFEIFFKKKCVVLNSYSGCELTQTGYCEYNINYK